jgi:hypothetical protein
MVTVQRRGWALAHQLYRRPGVPNPPLELRTLRATISRSAWFALQVDEANLSGKCGYALVSFQVALCSIAMIPPQAAEPLPIERLTAEAVHKADPSAAPLLGVAMPRSFFDSPALARANSGGAGGQGNPFRRSLAPAGGTNPFRQSTSVLEASVACSPPGATSSDWRFSQPPSKPLPLPGAGAAAAAAAAPAPAAVPSDSGRGAADVWRESASDSEWALSPPQRPPVSALISYY